MPLTASDLSAQLAEYHHAVSDVIGGTSLELLEAQKEIVNLKKLYNEQHEEIKVLKASVLHLSKNTFSE